MLEEPVVDVLVLVVRSTKGALADTAWEADAFDIGADILRGSGVDVRERVAHLTADVVLLAHAALSSWEPARTSPHLQPWLPSNASSWLCSPAPSMSVMMSAQSRSDKRPAPSCIGSGSWRAGSISQWLWPRHQTQIEPSLLEPFVSL